jgi:hypothetical protein
MNDLLAQRERAAVERLVERVARVYAAGSTLYETDAGGPPQAIERADVVVSRDEALSGSEWRTHVIALASRAAKALVVVQSNPHRLAFDADRRAPDPDDFLRILWELGRVREHAYLVFPRPVEVLAAVKGSLGAHDVAFAPAGPLVRRMARLHAYVVDTSPRTPQARRRLRIAAAPD